jgi:hypothetical protein
MTGRPILFICGLAAVALAGGACGSSGVATEQPASTTSPVTQSPTPVPTPTPAATYPPLPAGFPPPPAGFPVGKYIGQLVSEQAGPATLWLNPDGSYHLLGPPTGVAKVFGDYTVSGNRITFHGIVDFCSSPGSYTWQISGSTLKFTLINDPCDHGLRGQDFATHPWIRS